jgi:hypothetical protein
MAVLTESFVRNDGFTIRFKYNDVKTVLGGVTWRG